MLTGAVCAAMPTTQEQQQQQPPSDERDQRQDHGGPGPPPPGSGGRPVRASYELQLKVQAQLTTMSDEEKMALGHSLEDLIVDCEFAGSTCSLSYVNYITQAKNYSTRIFSWTLKGPIRCMS